MFIYQNAFMYIDFHNKMNLNSVHLLQAKCNKLHPFHQHDDVTINLELNKIVPNPMLRIMLSHNAAMLFLLGGLTYLWSSVLTICPEAFITHYVYQRDVFDDEKFMFAVLVFA